MACGCGRRRKLSRPRGIFLFFFPFNTLVPPGRRRTWLSLRAKHLSRHGLRLLTFARVIDVRVSTRQPICGLVLRREGFRACRAEAEDAPHGVAQGQNRLCTCGKKKHLSPGCQFGVPIGLDVALGQVSPATSPNECARGTRGETGDYGPAQRLMAGDFYYARPGSRVCAKPEEHCETVSSPSITKLQPGRMNRAPAAATNTKALH